MSKVVEKNFGRYNESDWVIINCVELSKTTKCSKILTLKHPKNNNEFILADLRIFNNRGRATKNGVCLTEFEFDYLTRVLVHAKEVEQTNVNKTGARILCISPKPYIEGVEITQTVNDRVRKLRLNEFECKKLVNDYESYYSIIDECLCESLEDCSDEETNIKRDEVPKDDLESPSPVDIQSVNKAESEHYVDPADSPAEKWLESGTPSLKRRHEIVDTNTRIVDSKEIPLDSESLPQFEHLHSPASFGGDCLEPVTKVLKHSKHQL